MARLPVIDPKTADGKVKEIFEGPLKGKEINIFKGMANSPVGLKAYLGLAGALGEGTLSNKQKEAVALLIGETNNCDYCVAAHTQMGKGAGLTEDQTVAIRKGEAIGDEKIDALVGFTKALLEKRGFVDDSDIEAFKGAGFTDGQIVEVIVVFALNVYTNVFNHVNETEVDFPAVPALA